MHFEAPGLGKNAFTCPHCSVRSQQEWSTVRLLLHGNNPGGGTFQSRAWQMPADYRISACYVCRELAFWNELGLQWPPSMVAPVCAPDCPPDVKVVYEEAREVYSRSPRASAALLRLAIQMICNELVPSEKDLNKSIGKLVDRGLPKKLQQALDVVRVIGNNAVHPGQINLNDEPAVALNLFSLVNMIIENMITQPKEIEKMFGSLPESTLAQIEKRDA